MGQDLDDPVGYSRYLKFEGERLRAREIMGRNFLGLDEAEKYFGEMLGEDSHIALAKIPWTERVLQSVKDTHILVAVPSMSILDIRDMVGQVLFGGRRTIYSWKGIGGHVKDRGKTGWHLVRKTAVEHSGNKTWEEQQILLA